MCTCGETARRELSTYHQCCSWSPSSSHMKPPFRHVRHWWATEERELGVYGGAIFGTCPTTKGETGLTACVQAWGAEEKANTRAKSSFSRPMSCLVGPRLTCRLIGHMRPGNWSRGEANTRTSLCPSVPMPCLANPFTYPARARPPL